MEFQIVAVGNLKEAYLREGIGEYAKRLSRTGGLTVLEVEEAVKGTPEEIVAEEGRRILRKLKPDTVVAALAITGKGMSSEELASWIGETGTYRSSRICFVIGGSHGLSREVLDRADLKLSFSKMTFPHQLMRLILAEQIYRSVKILRNEQYHK